MSLKMKKCKTCNADIAKSAKRCPHCGAKNKKPFFLRGWFVLLALIGIVAIMGLSIVVSADFVITVNTNGSITTIRASEVSKMVKDNPQKYLDDFVNSGAEVSFTAKVQELEYAYDGYDGFLSYNFTHYIRAMVPPFVSGAGSCEDGDTVKVFGKFVDYKAVGGNTIYIRLEAVSIEEAH